MMRMLKCCTFLPVFGLLLLSAAGGCGADKPGWASFNPSDWANQRVADDPLVFDLEGPISVDVETFAGDVSIEADPKLKQGEVRIVREGLHGFGRSKEAKASLGDINATAELGAADTSRGELGQTLRIRASSTNPEVYLQRAHIFVKAPAIDGVFVHSEDGSITVRHIEGTVDIEGSNGVVSVRTNLVMNHPVTIINKNGDVIYRAGAGSSGDVDAQTVNGLANADIRYGAVTVAPVTRNDLFRGTINGGTNRVVLRTTNGDVKIAVMKENENTVLLPSSHAPPKPAEPPAGSAPANSNPPASQP
jgi:DUF4097 and DUF4098 domain-containing protein YvlB